MIADQSDQGPIIGCSASIMGGWWRLLLWFLDQFDSNLFYWSLWLKLGCLSKVDLVQAHKDHQAQSGCHGGGQLHGF